MHGHRQFTTPPGPIQVDRNMNSKYGAGTVARSINEPVDRLIKNEGGDKYFRRDLRLNDDPEKRAMRRGSEELWMRLFRRQPQDPRGFRGFYRRGSRF